VKTPARVYRPSFNQFLAGRKLAWRRDFWRFEARIIAAAMLAYAVLGLFPDLELRQDVSLRGAVLSALVAVLGYVFLDWVRFKRRVKRDHEAFGSEPTQLYAFRDEGIEFSGSNTFGIEEWEHIDHWTETSDTIFLFGRMRLVGVYLSLIVSKNQISPEEIAFLIKRLDEHGIPKK
jgi:hypothetical protein